MTLRIDANGPLDVASVMSTLINHAVPGVDIVEPETPRYTRMVDIGGAAHTVTLTFDAHGIDVDALSVAASDHDALRRCVTGWFDLDTDISLVDACFADDVHLAADARERPGVRIVGTRTRSKRPS